MDRPGQQQVKRPRCRAILLHLRLIIAAALTNGKHIRRHRVCWACWFGVASLASESGEPPELSLLHEELASSIACVVQEFPGGVVPPDRRWAKTGERSG